MDRKCRSFADQKNVNWFWVSQSVSNVFSELRLRLLKFQIWSCEVCKVFETDRRAGFNRRWGYGNVKDNYWTGKKYISTDTPLQVPFPSCIQQSGLKYIGGISLIMHHSQGRAPLRFKMNNEHGLGYWFGHQKCVVAACVYQPGTAMDCLVPN